MKKIDISSWERKDIYAFYKDMDMPRYQMTFEIDVTGFINMLKQMSYLFIII